MRNLIAIIFLSFCKILIAQHDIVETDSLLLWQSDRKLTWGDFKGQPKENPINEVANIKVIILATHKKWNRDIPEFQVNAYMKKYFAWSIVSDSLSLDHEQGHFDIYEIHARKVRKAYDSLNNSGVNEIKTYERVYKNIMKECKRYNYSYEYSNFNEKTQQEWIDKIAKDLQNLIEYAYKPTE